MHPFTLARRQGHRLLFGSTAMLLTGALFLAGPVFAQALPPVGGITGLPGGGATNADAVESKVIRIIEVFLSILGIIAVVVIIIAGARLIFAGGDEEAARTARRQILYAVVGLIVILLSLVIVNLVISLFPNS